MSEFSISSTTTKKTDHFPSLLLSDFFLFCAFILSHPMYFFYFIFFSPYLFKLLSFLSPLFITTSLLLLVLLTVSPNLVLDKCHSGFSESKVSFVLATYQALAERLRCKVEVGEEEDQFHDFEELEVYKIVFKTSNPEESQVEVLDEPEPKQNYLARSEALHVSKVSSSVGGGNPQVVDDNLEGNPGNAQLIADGKSLGAFLHQKEELLEDLWWEKGEQEVKPLSVKSNKVDETKEEALMRSGSKAFCRNIKTSEAKSLNSEDDSFSKLSYQSLEEASTWSPDNGGYYTPKMAGNAETLMGSNLGSFGSMRREREWRRTLACKLFEERHNANGDEGMDLLWETYETDSIKVRAKSKSTKGKEEYYDHDQEEEEEEEHNGQLCCLQALKFSAGKMNLGMRKPNLVKITKALKGIGWLHHVSRHGKKGLHR
ncbi:hypothetical protein Tsubulata_030438 [Turnera subulata]|uniref:Uncharacterized protein n=1 Tax=Turnera subulata TaxID=218843 RepID=A0A9Q0FH57_9ROSI|nr:hypothetical protein Tsubulata_030438 [Turnera subulata]